MFKIYNQYANNFHRPGNYKIHYVLKNRQTHTNYGGGGGGGESGGGKFSPPVIFVAGLSRRLFCFGFLVILDVARCYLWLFTLYINIK